MTTTELRNRKKQNKVTNRPQDLRSRLGGSATKVQDARTKLQEKRSVQQLTGQTNVTLNERRKQQRSDLHASNRSLRLESGTIKITSKQQLPPDRSAKVTGHTIKITAKVDPKSKAKSKNRGKDRDRNLQMNNTGGITIKAKPEPSPRRKKYNFGASKLHMDQVNGQEDIAHYEYEKFKTAHAMEKQQLSIFPPWKQPVPITDRLDGPMMEPRRTPQSQTSTKVTITNLHPSVTRQDIEELFGVVGVLKSCKIIQPGIAEVIYTIKEDAITAYARYHNRNLDGQPMQCKLSAVQTYSPAHTVPSMPPVRPAAPPSPKLFHTPVIPYVPTKRPSEQLSMPPTQPVVFKVKI